MQVVYTACPLDGTRGRIRTHQHATRHFCLDLTATVSKHRRSFTTPDLETRDTKGPPTRPLLLFTALSNLRRASSIQSRAHPTDHTADHVERRAKPHTQNTTRTRTDPTNRSKLKQAKQDRESLHPPETRTDYGEAEEASTSRRQKPAAAKLWKPPPPGNRTQTTIIFTAPTLQATASSLQEQNHRGRCLAREPTTAKLRKLPPRGDKNRRRRSCGSLHLPETEPKQLSSSPRQPSKQPRLHSKNRTTAEGVWPEVRQGGH
ncbi:hypothetical protein F2Q69_00028412 [Brassica cretica]|uniref:Uncharacterized protein n=1 Tax=Brassica cretica TaxID=69181 RepID=A0A8S9S1W1_BRACR|nr:hypothetical protein F2Q69_00028412 [Brassica cretica]